MDSAKKSDPLPYETPAQIKNPRAKEPGVAQAISIIGAVLIAIVGYGIGGLIQLEVSMRHYSPVSPVPWSTADNVIYYFGAAVPYISWASAIWLVIWSFRRTLSAKEIDKT